MKLSQFANDWISTCYEEAKQHSASGLKVIAPDGIYAISPPIAMASAAGWYVGEVCLSIYDGQLYPEPYDRLTDYMDEASALSFAESLRE